MFVGNFNYTKLKIMEAIIVILLLAILAVPVVLLIWFKMSTSSLIREVLYKMNALHIKVDKLKEEQVSAKVEEDTTLDERVERLIDIVPEVKKVEQPKVEEI